MREARRIWHGLGSQLCEVQIGSSAVADSHGFSELALGVEAVENNAVDGNGKNFNNYFDNAADEGPVLCKMSVKIRRLSKNAVDIPEDGR